jgi:hypothetical protein
MTLRFVPAIAAARALGACNGGLFNRGAPDEFAVSRQAPLVIPPDFNLAPPAPGTPRPIGPDTRAEALQTLFPGQTIPPRSVTEEEILRQSGASRADPGARSNVADPDTAVVNKGGLTRRIVEAPEGGDTTVARVEPGAL